MLPSSGDPAQRTSVWNKNTLVCHDPPFLLLKAFIPLLQPVTYLKWPTLLPNLTWSTDEHTMLWSEAVIPAYIIRRKHCFPYLIATDLTATSVGKSADNTPLGFLAPWPKLFEPKERQGISSEPIETVSFEHNVHHEHY